MYFYLKQAEGATVLIEAEHEGVKTPIAWTRNYGKGKVFYNHCYVCFFLKQI